MGSQCSFFFFFFFFFQGRCWVVAAKFWIFCDSRDSTAGLKPAVLVPFCWKRGHRDNPAEPGLPLIGGGRSLAGCCIHVYMYIAESSLHSWGKSGSDRTHVDTRPSQAPDIGLCWFIWRPPVLCEQDELSSRCLALVWAVFFLSVRLLALPFCFHCCTSRQVLA